MSDEYIIDSDEDVVEDLQCTLECHEHDMIRIAPGHEMHRDGNRCDLCNSRLTNHRYVEAGKVKIHCAPDQSWWYRCNECDFDICMYCYALPPVLNIGGDEYQLSQYLGELPEYELIDETADAERYVDMYIACEEHIRARLGGT